MSEGNSQIRELFEKLKQRIAVAQNIKAGTALGAKTYTFRCTDMRDHVTVIVDPEKLITELSVGPAFITAFDAEDTKELMAIFAQKEMKLIEKATADFLGKGKA